MYHSFGEHLIAEKVNAAQTNTYGIIIDAESLPRYTVVEAPEGYSDLKDKTIVILDDSKAALLPDKKHYAINYRSIIAVEK